MEYRTELINVFDFELIKYKIPDYLYNDKSLQKNIDKVFSLDSFYSENYKKIMEENLIESRGIVHSTISLSNREINLDFFYFHPVFDYIDFAIKTYFFTKFEQKVKILYSEMWVNKMFKNSSVNCHRHNPLYDYVGIFYYKVPPNSGDLIILKEHIYGVFKEKNKDISYFMKINTGDLIIHPTNVPHAVSEHLNDDPRISFIFNFSIDKKFDISKIITYN